MTKAHELERSKQTADTASRDADAIAPGRIARSAALLGPNGPMPSGLIQRKARDANGVEDGAGDAVARAASSSGTALPEMLMRKFESSLGTDLSGVRVHTGGESAAAAGAVGAKAYTLGQDIHFGAGHFDPTSNAGEHLLAHEVAHTVQQRGGVARVQLKPEVSSPGDAHEVEADRAADAMVAGTTATVAGAVPTISRVPEGTGASPAGGGGDAVEETIFRFVGPFVPSGATAISNDVGDKLRSAVQGSGTFAGIDSADEILSDMSEFLTGDVWQSPTSTMSKSFTGKFQKDGEDWEGTWTVGIRPMFMPAMAKTRERIPGNKISDMTLTSSKGATSTSSFGTQSQDQQSSTQSAGAEAGVSKDGPSGGVSVGVQNSRTGTSGSGRGNSGAATAGTSGQSIASGIVFTSTVIYTVSISARLNPAKAVTAADPTPKQLDNREHAETLGGLTDWLNPVSAAVHVSKWAGDSKSETDEVRERLARHKPESRSNTAVVASKIVIKIPLDACSKETHRIGPDFDP